MGGEVFCHSLKFGSWIFLEIAYDDSLRQCLTSGRGQIVICKWNDPEFSELTADRALFLNSGNQSVLVAILK